GAELLGRGAHRLTIVLGSGRISEGLMGRITPIADQMTQQNQPVIRPSIGLGWLRYSARESNPVTQLQLPGSHPALAGKHPVLFRDPDGAAARELDAGNGAFTDLPHHVGSSRDDALLLIDRPDFGLRAHQARDRNLSTVGQPDEGVARDALAKVRHNGLLVLALLNRAVEL